MVKIIALFVFLLPSVAAASSVLALSEPEMVAAADTIILGTVVQKETYLAGPGQAVRTRVLLQVQHGMRGAVEGDVVTVDIPGGFYNGLQVRASGVPALPVGAMVVVFLQTRGSIKLPLGLAMGVYSVTGAQPFQVMRDFTGLSLVGTAHVDSRPEKLKTFIERIETRVRVMLRSPR